MSISIKKKGNTEQAKKDALRHKEKQKEAISKDQLKKILLREEVIARDVEGRKVKIPLKYLEIPDFRPGTRKPAKSGGKGGQSDKGGKAGFGQGEEGEGESVSVNEGGSGSDEHSEIEFEAEFDLSDILQQEFDYYGLPNIKEKEGPEKVEETKELKIKGIRSTGPWLMLSRRHTVNKSMRRFFAYLEFLKEETKRSEIDCFAALEMTGGDISESLKLLDSPNFSHNKKEIEPFPILHGDDLTYFSFGEKNIGKTNAVFFVLMDVSGSVGENKRRVARVMAASMVGPLRKKYQTVEVVFIVHEESARRVSELEFFSAESKGGTHCYAAFKLAGEIIKKEYPPEDWNIYVVHFSDGEDSHSFIENTAKEVKNLIENGVNLAIYCEIFPGATAGADSKNLFNFFRSRLPVVAYNRRDVHFLEGKKDSPFLASRIEADSQVKIALEDMLKPDRRW